MTFNSSVNQKVWRTWILTFLKIIDKHWPQFSIGTYPGHDPSEADAADFMVPNYKTTAGRKLAAQLADWIWKYRKFFGIWYQIYWGRIRSMTYEAAGWRPYFAANSTDDSKNHHNHVHVSWYEGKNKSAGKGPDDVTSTPPASPTPPATAVPAAPYSEKWLPDLPWVFFLDRQKIGIKDSTSVWILQRALQAQSPVIYTGPRDGAYTAAVQTAVKALQKSWGDDVQDGILGPLGAAKLFGEHVTVEAES